MGGHDSNATAALAGLAALLAPVLALIALLTLIVTLLAPSSHAACTPPATTQAVAGEGGEWTATAYGPPWEGIQGTGITKTGINLQQDPHKYIIAVDPSVIHLGTYWHVVPNPWGKPKLRFLAGDTGSAILGRHVDIYDWEGRAAQDAWGSRHVTLTPAAGNGTAGVLKASPATESAGEGEAAGCEGEPEGPLPLTASQTATVESDGLAAAPREAPQAVKDMIAAGNRLHEATYVYGAGHGPPLSTLQPAYDCSSAVSYVLHAGGVFGNYAWVSGELENYGEPGPGKWVTVYANSEHAFMYVAGVRFDTSWKGTDNGPNDGENGPRWRVYPEVPTWAKWVVRHPPGM